MTPTPAQHHPDDTTPTTEIPEVTARAPLTAGPRPGRVWAYLGIVTGAVVSVAANVAHSFVPPPDLTTTATAATVASTTGVWHPEPGAVLGAMFWPLALLITTEIMTRTVWPPGRAWLLLRFAGLLPVAGVAGIVSYLHLHGLLQHYHEAPLTCLIAPFSVDGLMVMASSALAAGTHHPGHTASAAASAPAREPATTDAGPDAGRARRTRPRRPDTAADIARLTGHDPDLTTAQLAARLGVSARTIRRHRAAQATATASR